MYVYARVGCLFTGQFSLEIIERSSGHKLPASAPCSATLFFSREGIDIPRLSRKEKESSKLSPNNLNASKITYEVFLEASRCMGNAQGVRRRETCIRGMLSKKNQAKGAIVI